MSLLDVKNKCLEDTKRRGATIRESALKGLSVTYNKAKELSSTNVQFTTIEDIIYEKRIKSESVIVNDPKQNDKSFFDEKILICDLDTEIEVGTYVNILGKWYLVIFEEVRPTNIYKEFTARKCTREISTKRIWLFGKDEVLPRFKEEIVKIPIIVENLTLYSEGIREINYGMLSIVDGKRNIFYGTNSRFHKFMSVGRRFMLSGENVFNITHIDNFSYEGITQITAMQTVTIPDDNKELNVADYYSKDNNSTDVNDTPNLSDYRMLLSGVEKLKIGSKQLYVAKVVGLDDSEIDTPLQWNVDVIKGSVSDITVDLINNKSLTISAKSDLDIIGGQLLVTVSILREPSVCIEKTITITSVI